jgi:hypothetical protein
MHAVHRAGHDSHTAMQYYHGVTSFPMGNKKGTNSQLCAE